MKLNKTQRAELKQKFGGHCAYCGILLGEKWHADHILPVRRDFRWVKNEETGNHVAKANGVLLTTLFFLSKSRFLKRAWLLQMQS